MDVERIVVSSFQETIRDRVADCLLVLFFPTHTSNWVREFIQRAEFYCRLEVKNEEVISFYLTFNDPYEGVQICGTRDSWRDRLLWDRIAESILADYADVLN